MCENSEHRAPSSLDERPAARRPAGAVAPDAAPSTRTGARRQLPAAGTPVARSTEDLRARRPAARSHRTRLQAHAQALGSSCPRQARLVLALRKTCGRGDLRRGCTGRGSKHTHRRSAAAASGRLASCSLDATPAAARSHMTRSKHTHAEALGGSHWRQARLVLARRKDPRARSQPTAARTAEHALSAGVRSPADPRATSIPHSRRARHSVAVGRATRRGARVGGGSLSRSVSCNGHEFNLARTRAFRQGRRLRCADRGFNGRQASGCQVAPGTAAAERATGAVGSSARWQATSRSLTRRNSGGSTLQRSIASGQRG